MERHQLCFPILDSRAYLASSCRLEKLIAANRNCDILRIDDFEYIPFCDDFGPFNLTTVHEFVNAFHQKLESSESTTVICVDGTCRETTNATFLLGCYLVMIKNMNPEEVMSTFRVISFALCPFRDSSFEEADFDIGLLDCWRAIFHSKQIGWIDKFDMEEFMHYDNPLEGDLHTIIPGKLIAFKGPKAMPMPQLYRDRDGRRTFSPHFFAEPFADMGVRTVVRLNEREYADADFEEHGIRCVSLEFDGPTPPPDVVIAFLHTLRAAPGAVAVHCRSGLGRTGALIGALLVLSHGFSAREAIAWLRILRPGSVVGEQQHYLLAVETMLSLLDTDHSDAPPQPPPPPPPLQETVSEPPAPLPTSSQPSPPQPAAAQDPPAFPSPRDFAPHAPISALDLAGLDGPAAAAAERAHGPVSARVHRAVLRLQADRQRLEVECGAQARAQSAVFASPRLRRTCEGRPRG
jgi:cell division cycle 14